MKQTSLVLHEGLIEELCSKMKYYEGSELCYLNRFSRIIRTSGKGRDPRKLDERLPFCEYSALSAVLAPYTKETVEDGVGKRKEKIRLEKVMMAKSVLNAFGEMRGKEDKR